MAFKGHSFTSQTVPQTYPTVNNNLLLLLIAFCLSGPPVGLESMWTKNIIIIYYGLSRNGEMKISIYFAFLSACTIKMNYAILPHCKDNKQGRPVFFEMLKQNWFVDIARPAGFSFFCVFSLFIILFARINQTNQCWVWVIYCISV